uniref:Uncharacterized protein n=1 Tax=Acrobeloides nanus TaxID=290746 RepID=A0A914DHB4_9BILA
MRPSLLVSLILSFIIVINFETFNIDALPTNTGITTKESLLSCFMRCSTSTPEEPIREKRQVQRVVNQIISEWKLMQTKSILIAQDCKAQELE